MHIVTAMQIRGYGMVCGFAAALTMSVFAQAPSTMTGQGATTDDPVKTMVSRLELDKYKATIKGLTQFGDRRQGTRRNRDAVDWIEAQLKSYGCTNTERITYDYAPAPPRANAGAAGAGGANRPAPGEPGTVQSVGPTNGQGG